MIIEDSKVILEQKDLEKLFQRVFTTTDNIGKVSDSLFCGELIFVLKKEFTIDEINFTIPDINIPTSAKHIQLSYRCSITDYHSIDDSIDDNLGEEKYEVVSIYDLFEGGYYLLQYDYKDPNKQGIVIDIDKEEISKFKLTYL